MPDIGSYLIYGVPALTLTLAIVKLARVAGMPSKYAPVISIGSNLIAGMGWASTQGEPLGAGIVAGILLGASACGVYDAAKISK